jgi:MFS family permease
LTAPARPSSAPRRPGFFYGRVIASTAFAATFGSVVFFNPVLGVFSSSLEDAFGWTRAEVALALTVGGAIAAVAGPFVGWVIDRWGGRWVMSGAAIVMGVCLIALSRMTALWELLVFYSAGRALSVGVLTPSAYVAVANWYVRRRAFVTGIVAAGSRVGMAVLPVLAALVISATGDWRDGWLALAAVILLVGVAPPLVFMRRRPEDVGLLPDGDQPAEAIADAALPLAADGTDGFTLREAASTRAYWLIALAMSLVFFAGGSVNFHQIPHLVDQGLPRTEAAFVVTVFSLIGAAGGLTGGAVAARTSVRWTMAAALAGMGGGILLLAVASNLLTALVYAVTYGIFFGAMNALSQVIWADYFGRRSVGLIQGSVQPVQMAMNAMGPYLTGLWYVANGSYTVPFVTFAIFFVVAAGGVALAPHPARAGLAVAR